MRTFVVLYKIGYEIGHYWNGFFFSGNEWPCPSVKRYLITYLVPYARQRRSYEFILLPVHPYYWVQNKAPPPSLINFWTFFPTHLPPLPQCLVGPSVYLLFQIFYLFQIVYLAFKSTCVCNQFFSEFVH